MGFANPTSLRLGARGSLHGWKMRVAGRAVLGVEVDGETYYWHEFRLVGDSGNDGTLVFEETESGPEWKLFREFTPVHALSAVEAATKRVGDTVNLDGTPRRITLVDQSRVYLVEGEPPEGMEVGDVAHYLNADTGRRMLVASWTGDEIEFYEGEDVPAALVAQAFGFPPTKPRPGGLASLREAVGGTAEPSSTRNYVTIAVVGIFVLAIVGAVIWAWKSDGPTAGATPSRPTVLPVVQLVPGTRGQLGPDTYTLTGVATVDIARVNGPQQRREYQLAEDSGPGAFLVQGLSGQQKEWHLLRPLPLTVNADPYALAALKRGAWITLSGQRMHLLELFSAKVLTKEPAADAMPTAGATRYGFLAEINGGRVVARWDERGAELHTATPFAEADVVRAFGPAATRAAK